MLALVHMRVLSHYAACRRTRSGKLLPGPSFAVPLVGGVVDMVLNPFRFWEDQWKMSFPGMSSALTHVILAGSCLHVNRCWLFHIADSNPAEVDAQHLFADKQGLWQAPHWPFARAYVAGKAQRSYCR